MRIVCEQCQTKYIVPDDKIVKNVLRLTCQKCGHVITTRVEETDASERSTLGKWRATGLNTPRRTSFERAIWYYSYNGESFGPYTESELKEKFLSDKLFPIAEQCYVWNKSLPEWQPVMEVEPFSSAILMPPPPPPPAPAPVPKKSSSNLPPLYSNSYAHNGTSARTSSSGLKGLSNRLPSSSDGDKPTISMQSASVVEGMAETDAKRKQEPRTLSMHSDDLLAGFSRISSQRNEKVKRQDDMPTHQAFPAVESVNESHAEEDEDETRVGPSPLISFQSLDAISPDIKAVTLSGEAKALQGRLPSLSKLPALDAKKLRQPSTSTAGNRSVARTGFPAAEKQAPGISSLFGSSASKDSKPAGIPKFGGLKSLDAAAGVKPGESSSGRLNAADVLIQKAPEPESAPQSGVEEAQESDISLSDLSLSADPITAEGSLDNIDFGAISLEMSEASLPGIDLDGEPNEILKAIEGTAEKGAQSNNGIGSVKRDKSNSQLPGVMLDAEPGKSPRFGGGEESNGPTVVGNNVLLDGVLENEIGIDISEEPKGEPLKVVSPTDMLGMRTGAETQVAESPVAASMAVASEVADSLEVEGINLDDDNSQLPLLKKPNTPVAASNPEDKSASKESGESKTSSSLDEIQSRHAALLAEIANAENLNSTDEHISEKSMLIQIEHFQKQAHKSNRTMIIAIVAIVAAIVAAIVYVAMSSDNEVKPSPVPEISETTGGFAEVTGRAVTSDELDENLIPSDDFEIVTTQERPAAPEPAPSGHRPRHSKSGDAANAKKPENSDDPTEAMLDKIYGKKNDGAADNAQAEVRNDGRANVALKPQESFASTESLTGSKYQVGGAPSAREMFSVGLKSVSKTVQECYKREAKNGNMNIQKIYISLTVEPSGKVDHFEIENKAVPENFGKCLEGKKERWKFAPFDGKAAQIRQGFVLGD